jgi:hypothetical protein
MQYKLKSNHNDFTKKLLGSCPKHTYDFSPQGSSEVAASASAVEPIGTLNNKKIGADAVNEHRAGV